MATKDLEKEYTPTQWTKRFPPGPEVLRHHIDIVTQETQRNLGKYNCTRSIRYGSSDMERMDLYFKQSEDFSADTPIVVYIHGGYWQELTKDQSAYCVSPLVENGCRVVIVDYDLCPSVTLEEIVDEIQRAIITVFQYAEKTGGRKISVIGHSAGAHLTASVLQREKLRGIPNIEKLASVFLISGIYDLTELQKTSVNRNNMLSLDEKNVRMCSPAFHNYEHLRRLNVKVNVYVAENDSPTFIKQSKDFHEYLGVSGVSTHFQIIPDCDHFDIVENLAQENFEITQKILEQVKSEH